jgi:hypothetical protein
MAASTISRDSWTNDSGSAASPNGDGTVLQNSVLQNHIYARVDELLSGAGSYTILRFGGLIAAEGFGTNTFSAGGTGSQIIALRNTTAGTANYTTFQLGNDATAAAAILSHTSTSHSAGGLYPVDGAMLDATRSGGLRLIASNAAGTIQFYTGSTEKARLSFVGGFSIGSTTDPGAGILLLSKAVRFAGTTAPTGVSGSGLLYFDSTSGTLKLSNDNGSFQDVLTGPLDKVGVFHSASQAITGDNTWRAATFDSESYDDESMHSTSSNPTRITILTSGVHRFIGHSGAIGTVNTGLYMAVRVNGSSSEVYGAIEMGDNSLGMANAWEIEVDAGDYVELVFLHATTGFSVGSATRANATSFTCALVP